MENKDVSAILNEIGNLLEIKNENPFKVRAYYKAARNIEALPESIEEVIAKGKLGEIDGIGEALEQKITEFVRTGKMKYYAEIRKDVPDGLLDMLKIPGLGPKKVKALYDKTGVKGIECLKKACEQNKLLKLDGFGEKTQTNILEGIKFVMGHADKFLLSQAMPLAQELVALLKKCPSIQQVSLAGSIRRWKEVVKDIDIVVSSSQSQKVMDYFTTLGQVQTIVAKGETKSSIRLKGLGIACDLRVVKDAEFPYALHHFTGSKDHHVAMRGRANRMGLKINEYGIFRDKDNKLLPCKDEEEFFKALELNYIPPELRENMGEVDYAEKSPLPILVERKDIRGVFHAHTNWSDGMASIEDMAEAACRAGLEWLGLTEHSKSASYANGLDEKRLAKWIGEVDKVNKKGKAFRILKGTEVDILKNGELDFSNKVLAQLDFVVGSVHSNFTMPEQEMTERIIRALQNKHLTMIGHPTGRLLLEREGYKVNLDRILDNAKKYGKTMELNAHPKRLDLDWIHLKRAKELGVKISINPDAHNIHGFGDISYGVATARRGWLTKKDVVNSLSLEQILGYLKANIK